MLHLTPVTDAPPELTAIEAIATRIALITAQYPCDREPLRRLLVEFAAEIKRAPREG